MSGPKKSVIIKLHPERKEYVRAENEFLRVVGSCVNTWAFVDREIFRIFRFCLHRLGIDRPSKIASILYYKQRQFQQRVQLTDEMLDPSLVLTVTEYDDDWLPLRKKLQDLSQIRNIIAHQPALRTHTAKRGRAAYLYSIHIEPYQLLSRKPNPILKGKKALEISDLKQHAKDVDGLVVELQAFLKRLNQAHQRP
jgi:hypothetical protein